MSPLLWLNPHHGWTPHTLLTLHSSLIGADPFRGSLGRILPPVRGCSHMMSAKNGGVQTPPPPLVSQKKNWPTPLRTCKKNHKPAYPAPPLPLVKNLILMYQFNLKENTL